MRALSQKVFFQRIHDETDWIEPETPQEFATYLTDLYETPTKMYVTQCTDWHETWSGSIMSKLSYDQWVKNIYTACRVRCVDEKFIGDSE
jgi:hypothetical protein